MSLRHHHLILPLSARAQVTHTSHSLGFFFMVCNFFEITGTPFDPVFMLSCAVSNVICSIVFGKRYDCKDKKFLSLMKNMNNIMNMMNSFWGQVHPVDISLRHHSLRGA